MSLYRVEAVPVMSDLSALGGSPFVEYCDAAILNASDIL